MRKGVLESNTQKSVLGSTRHFGMLGCGKRLSKRQRFQNLEGGEKDGGGAGDLSGDLRGSSYVDEKEKGLMSAQEAQRGDCKKNPKREKTRILKRIVRRSGSGGFGSQQCASTSSRHKENP